MRLSNCSFNRYLLSVYYARSMSCFVRGNVVVVDMISTSRKNQKDNCPIVVSTMKERKKQLDWRLRVLLY